MSANIGIEVPAITTRKVKTEVELGDGQSFVIGGLLDNTRARDLREDSVPGDIPILGKFFQSKLKTRTNTELIVIVTPEIVSPMAASAKRSEPEVPGASSCPPNSNIR